MDSNSQRGCVLSALSNSASSSGCTRPNGMNDSKRAVEHALQGDSSRTEARMFLRV